MIDFARIKGLKYAKYAIHAKRELQSTFYQGIKDDDL